MPHMREVKTCERCRHFKRRCDLLKPACTRCVQAGVRCSFQPANGRDSSSATGKRASASGRGASTSVAVDGAQPGLISPSMSAREVKTSRSPSFSATTALDDPNEDDGEDDGDADGDADADEETSKGGTSATGPNTQLHRIVRKRKRNCLSCLRCHRLKVKCDKELPCGRCKSSGNGRECYYSYNKGPNGGKFPCPTIPVRSSGQGGGKSGQETWQVSHEPRGSTHWRDLMTKIGALTGKHSPSLAAALENVATNACLANFTLPGNFPFGTPGATKYYTRDAVTRLIESERPRCQEYIDRYVNLLDCVNPVIDPVEFQKEVDEYWLDPGGASHCWMAQLLMVMGLGAFATPEEPSIATELMMGAEACLMQTPFMFRPTFAALKALTLMVIAKQDGDSGSLDKDEPAGARTARRRLWLTVIYLDLKLSIATGMPPLTRPDELRSLRSMPGDSSNEEQDTLQQVLSESLPLVLSVLVQINSGGEDGSKVMGYHEVLQLNAQLRALMAHAQRVCKNHLQRITVDIYLRRCLMVLHRPFALHLEGPTMFPESYWSSLECSLAVLMHYRELWYEDFSKRHDLVGRAFTVDFFSSALQTSVHLLRRDAPLAGGGGGGEITGNIPPRQIILNTLKSCVEIWRGEQEKSVCWRTAYEVLVAVLELMPEPAT